MLHFLHLVIETAHGKTINFIIEFLAVSSRAGNGFVPGLSLSQAWQLYYASDMPRLLQNLLIINGINV